METKIKQIAIGKRPTITILPSDLNRLKAMKQENESLYMALNRVISIAEKVQTECVG